MKQQYFLKMQFFSEITQFLNKLWTDTIEVCERKVWTVLYKICSTLGHTVDVLVWEKKKVIPHIIFKFLSSLNIFNSKWWWCLWEYYSGLVSWAEVSVVGNNPGPCSKRYTMDLRGEWQRGEEGSWITHKPCKCLSNYALQSLPLHIQSWAWPSPQLTTLWEQSGGKNGAVT